MKGAVYMAASGALLSQRRLEILSNNLANINTAGFKREKAFLSILENPREVRENLAAVAKSQGGGTVPLWQQLETKTILAQGVVKPTGNPFDLALEGKGFFCVESPEGERYTRSGGFTLSPEGDLVTHDGYRVLGKGGPIRIEGAAQFSVDEEGNVTIDGAQADKLKVVSFTEEASLERVGSTLFAASDLAGQEEKSGSIKVSQGFLEMSNVEAVQTMTEMIELLRGYEAYQKTIRQIDDMTSKSINEVGRV